MTTRVGLADGAHSTRCWPWRRSAFLIATADHLGVNGSRRTRRSDRWSSSSSWLAWSAVIAVDLYVLTRKLPPVPELDAALSAPATPVARWRRNLESRRMRFAAHRLDRSETAGVSGAERGLRQSVDALVDRAQG